MWRNFFQAGIDPLLARVARRLEWSQTQVARRATHCAVIDRSAVLHPSGAIENIHGDAEAIRVGAHTHVRGQLLTFWDHGRIQIGEWCYIGEGTRIWSQASISIGNHVLIAHGVDVHDTDSHPIDWQERRLDGQGILSAEGYRTPTQTISSPVSIEDDVWIGFKATVLKGVRLGRGAIIAACAVVTKDVAPWTIVAGNPARVVRELTPEERRGEPGNLP